MHGMMDSIIYLTPRCPHSAEIGNNDLPISLLRLLLVGVESYNINVNCVYIEIMLHSIHYIDAIY